MSQVEQRTQPVNYVRANEIIQRICLINLGFSWCCSLLLLLAKHYLWPEMMQQTAIFGLGLSFFFACLFAFAAMATNSISGQPKPERNYLPIACIVLSAPVITFFIGKIMSTAGG